jgi:hypothetical protein
MESSAQTLLESLRHPRAGLTMTGGRQKSRDGPVIFERMPLPVWGVVDVQQNQSTVYRQLGA